MIRKIIILQIITIVLMSCKTKDIVNKEQFVIISGQISNFNTNQNQIELHIYRLFNEKEIITSKLDSLGKFYFCFKSPIPLETELVYNSNLTVLTHPGDSIFVRFDGNEKIPELLNTVYFSGNTSKLNNDIVAFNKMLYSTYVPLNKVGQSQAIMQFDIPAFELYLDTLQSGFDNFINQYNTEITPSIEALNWGKFYLKQIIYDAIVNYQLRHQFQDNTKPAHSIIPVSFYDRFLDSTPIDFSIFLNSKELPRFIDKYWHFYTTLNYLADESYKENNTNRGYISPSVKFNDSIEYAGIIKYTPDKLLRQLILTEKELRNFERLHIESYEKNQEILSEFIQEPFLKDILTQKYALAFDKLNNTQISSDAILKKIKNSTVENIMDSILQASKGKVVYIDCWADWCGPCLEELPNSKKLEEEMNGKDVEFVYVCVESKEDVWKAIISKHQLNGQHYFLTKNQSEEWEKAFNISGVPYYFVIDKNGTIVENGSYLKPKVAKEKIESLLKE